ncbi:hypothetical protein, partial [Streptomyces sp. NPDC093600]|uniref:hypothetical protein n=1 Tax=Streptomyces sp. NPDC093600 TaxID=3366047 RepID=UPI00380BD5BE
MSLTASARTTRPAPPHGRGPRRRRPVAAVLALLAGLWSVLPAVALSPASAASAPAVALSPASAASAPAVALSPASAASAPAVALS